MIIRVILFVCILVAFSCSKNDPDSDRDSVFEIKGADISYLPEVRESGIRLFNKNGVEEDMLLTLRNSGVNTIRLRLWKNPTESVSSFNTVKELVNECRLLGLKVMLTVHYSDSWADPGKQTKPNEWQNLTPNQLLDSVYAYTSKIMLEIDPDFIQIGNEVNNGFLWPEGSMSNLPQMISLMNKAIESVRESNPNTKIIIHYAGISNAESFFSSLVDVDYDIIGLSYYPMWHGKSLTLLAQTMSSLSISFGKEVLIAETSYPFTLGWNDWTNNVVGSEDQILNEYSVTPQGQKDFFKKIIEISRGTPNGIGFCYWGGEWVSYKGSTAVDGSAWENQAFWDFENNALPILDEF
jgi:arabinogalactan endo-1,4-beta-galactosidase